jgi:hypothetical protein
MFRFFTPHNSQLAVEKVCAATETINAISLRLPSWIMLSTLQRMVRVEEQNGTVGMKPGTDQLPAGLVSGIRAEAVCGGTGDLELNVVRFEESPCIPRQIMALAL